MTEDNADITKTLTPKGEFKHESVYYMSCKSGNTERLRFKKSATMTKYLSTDVSDIRIQLIWEDGKDQIP